VSDPYTPQTVAEMAVTEFRRSWLEVLANWPVVSRDDELMQDLRAIMGGLEMKVAPDRKPRAA
jgi:hypothetical protein